MCVCVCVARPRQTVEWKRIFEEGERPHATLGEWLAWAEVDLDLPANEGVNAQWLTGSSTTQPFLCLNEGDLRFRYEIAKASDEDIITRARLPLRRHGAG